MQENARGGEWGEGIGKDGVQGQKVCAIDSLFMKNRFALFKCAYVSENVFQQFAGLRAILSDPATLVGIRANGDDLATQFPKAAEIVFCREKASAAVKTAGIQFQSLSFFRQRAQNLVHQFPVFIKGDRPRAGVTHGFADIGQVGQHIVVGVYLNSGQGLLEAPPLGFKHSLALPERGHIHIQSIHKMYGAQDKVKLPTFHVPAELVEVVTGHSKFHTPPNCESRYLQRIVLRAVFGGIESHIAHGSERIIVNVVGKADFFQSGVHCGLRHGDACVMSIKGYPGMHVVIEHFYLSQNWRNAVGSAACKLIASSVNQ